MGEKLKPALSDGHTRPARSARWSVRSSLAMRIAGTVFLVGVSIKMSDCRSAKAIASVASNPTVEFTSVPPAGPDNPKKENVIKGRVVGARPGQHIVLYARGQTTWWVQPFADRPLTTIQKDSTFINSTHPGMEYAALLVGPDFHPPLTTDVLPTDGVLASVVAKGEVPFWQKWWFPLVCTLAAAPIIFGAHRYRLHQMSKRLNERLEERLAERTRVAQELHDTLLQGVLSASMQLQIAIDQLPQDSPALPLLNRVVQLMGQVVNEGRNTVRGLRSSVESADDLKSCFCRIPQELAVHDGIDFRVVVQGASKPLRSVIRDDVYSIGREALVNAFRHSEASYIDVELEYAPHQLRIVVRDDGCGIDSHVLESGRDGHWGLSGMRERAERIGARLKVLSRTGAGTEVELRVPANVAFESARSQPPSKWSRFFAPGIRNKGVNSNTGVAR